MSTLVLIISGRIARADISALCERAGAMLRAVDAEQVVCDVGALVDPDAAIVEVLARLQLTAVSLGRRIQVHHACRELQELLDLAGLCDALRVSKDLGLELRGQIEEWEEALCIEEEADPADPAGRNLDDLE